MKKIYLLLTLVLITFGCQKENLPVQDENFDIIQTLDLDEALLILNLEKTRRKNKSTNQDFVIPDIENVYYKEITNSTEFLTVIPATIPDNSFSQILMLRINGTVQTVILSSYPENSEANDYFSGLLIVRNLNGTFLKGYRSHNGKIISKLLMSRNKNKTDWDLGSLDEVIVDAPSSETDSVPVEYVFVIETNDEPDRNTMDWEFEYTSGGGGGGTTTTTTEEEDKIDDSELTGKEKCLNALLDKKGDSYVKNLLSNFKGDDSEFDISVASTDKILIENISKAGLTQGPVNGVIRIFISSSEASTRPALDVARTLLHEYIHADMYRKLNTSNSTSEVLDFQNTYESFKAANFQASPQHETMASLYIGKMTTTLKNFHLEALPGDYNNLTNNGQNPLPDNFYEALAWRGLKEAGVAAYDALSLEKKTELENALQKYYHSSTSNCPNL